MLAASTEMITIFLLLFGLWMGGTGLVRVVAPAWQIEAERKAAARRNPPPAAAPVDPSPAPPPVIGDDRKVGMTRVAGAFRIALAALVFWLGGVTVGIAPQRPDPPADATGRAVHEKAEAFLRRGKAVGLVVGVISGNEEKLFTFGASHAGRRIPVGPETLFEIGSVTKVFTGIALAREVEGGEVRLEDTLEKLLPAGVSVPPEARAVTLRQLTTHTSGFPRLPGGGRPWAQANYLLFGGDPYAGSTRERWVEALETLELDSKPGEKMAYSNFGVSLLGWMLAQRRGMDYEAYTRRQVFEPLGMGDARVRLEGAERSRLAQGYSVVHRLGPMAVARRASPWPLADHLAAAGGIRAHGADMLKFLRAAMRPEGAPIAAAIRQSQQELFKESETRAVGMNWIRTRKKDGRTVVWHNGGTGGFSSYLAFIEGGDAGVFVLSNAGETVDSLGSDVLAALAGKP